MRPTDQNQTGSRRPNLMSSSRRTGAEINILAMLDGQARKPGPLAQLPRAAWYGSGGMLACALVGAVVWLLHDQAGSGFEGRVPAGPPAVPLEIVSETVPNPALQVDPPRTHGAAVVDVVDVAAAAADAASAAQPAPSGARVLDNAQQGAQALAVVTPASPPPASVPVRPDAPAVVPVSAAVTRSTHHAPHRVPPKAAPPARSVPAEARQPPSAHDRRTAPTARKGRPAPAAVDTDVALISAIIQHVNQRGEAKDAAAKMPNRP